MLRHLERYIPIHPMGIFNRISENTDLQVALEEKSGEHKFLYKILKGHPANKCCDISAEWLKLQEKKYSHLQNISLNGFIRNRH